MTSYVNEVISIFSSLDIPLEVYSHEPAYMLEERMGFVQQQLSGDNVGTWTKNILIHDQKYGHVLLTAAADKSINLAAVLHSFHGCLHGRVRFCDDEAILEKLHVPREVVSPLAMINCAANDIRYWALDRDLVYVDRIYLPLGNDRTVGLRLRDLDAFFGRIPHPPEYTLFIECRHKHD